MAEKEKKEKFIFEAKIVPLEVGEAYISDKLKDIYKKFLGQKAQEVLSSIGIKSIHDVYADESFENIKRQMLEAYYKMDGVEYSTIDFNNLYLFLFSINKDSPLRGTGDIVKYFLPYVVSDAINVNWYLPVFVKNIQEKMVGTMKDFFKANDGDIILMKGFVNSVEYISSIPLYLVIKHTACGGYFVVENDALVTRDLKDMLKAKVDRCPVCGSSNGSFSVEYVITTNGYRLVITDIPKAEGKEIRTINAYLLGKSMELYKNFITKANIFGIVRRVATEKRVHEYMEIYGIEPIEKTIDEVELTEEDIRQITNIVRDSGYNIIDMIAESMLPNIRGDQYKYIKRAVLLQSISILPQKEVDLLADRMHVNILLIGDPGTGKSTLLRTVAKLVPKSRYAVATASTKAGLLGTVTKSEEGRWILEIGALPSASEGILCIDEVDRLSKDDVKALNEAMEHGTATLDKAGVHVTLKANAAVLAAANPKFGRWDPNRELVNQIDIEPTMLSRFDLVFILRDVPNKEIDLLEAREILGKNKVENTYFSKDFILKYIAYARTIKPELSDEAEIYIARLYADLREKTADTFPITKRQIQTIKRLATAIAKARLSDVVTKEDIDYAWEILQNSIFSIVGKNATQLDFSVLETGMKGSTKSKILLVKEAIEMLNKRLGKAVTFNDIYNELKEKYGLDISETELRNYLALLKHEGDIYEPNPGTYSVL